MKWRMAILTLGALGVHSLPAQANLIEFNLNGQVAVSSGVLTDVAQGTAFQSRFVLDTTQFVVDDFHSATFSNPNFTTTEPVVDRFAVSGAGFQNVNVSIGTHTFSASTGHGGYDGRLSSPANGDDYDMSMSILASVFSLNFMDFSTTNTGGFALSELGIDPLGFLALGFDRAPAFTRFSGDFGSYGVAVNSLQVRSVPLTVPEPGTAWLFGIAIAFMGVSLSPRREKLLVAR